MNTAVSAGSRARHTALALIDADVTFKPHKTTPNGGKVDGSDGAPQSQTAHKSNMQMNIADSMTPVVNNRVLSSVPHPSERKAFDRREHDSTNAAGAHHAAALVATPAVQCSAPCLDRAHDQQDRRDEQLASATTPTPQASLADSGVTSQSTLSSISTASLDVLRPHPATYRVQLNYDARTDSGADTEDAPQLSNATGADSRTNLLAATRPAAQNGSKLQLRRVDYGKSHSGAPRRVEHWRSTIVLAEARSEADEAHLSTLADAGSAALRPQASVNDLASGYTTKRLEASENEVQITSAERDRPSAALINRSGIAHSAAQRPQAQARPPANALATTPRTLKSLSNIKAASSSFALATSASSKAPDAHNESATVGNSEKAEIEERRRNFIMEAHRKLHNAPVAEMREFGRKDSLAYTPSNLPQPQFELDTQHSTPTPVTTRRSIVPAKSESHLRQLLRTGALKQRSSNENGDSLTPTRNESLAQQLSTLTQRESHSRLHTPENATLRLESTKQLEGAHWSLSSQSSADIVPAKGNHLEMSLPSRSANQRQDSGNYRKSPSHDSLAAEPNNAGRSSFGLLNTSSASSTPFLPNQSSVNGNAHSFASQLSKQAAKSHMLLTQATQESAVSGAKTTTKQEVNMQQNALSVMNLSVNSQLTNRRDHQQFVMSSSSCTLLPDESQSVVFSTRSAATHASDLRRNMRHTIVKRNVCIQCNMTRAPPVVRDVKPITPMQPVRKSPTLSQILQYYELVTFRMQCDSSSNAKLIDYGIRLFESSFVDSCSTRDDAPWSINGKRPVLAIESSAFIKVVRPQTDKRDAAEPPACSLLAIDSLQENSVAHLDGRLCVGDYVVEVNGKLLLNQELPEAAEKLVNSSSQLVLVVARSLQRNTDDSQRKPVDKSALSRALQLELEMLKARYDRLKGEMKRNEVLIHEMRNAVARKVKIKQLVSAQTADSALKARSQNAFKTIYLEEQLVHVM